MGFIVFTLFVCVSFLRPEEIVGSKIIMSGPQATSHVMVQSSVASELIARGHEVYMAMGSRFDKPEMLERFGIKILYYHIPDDVIYGLTEDFEKAVVQAAFDPATPSPEYLASMMVNRDCTFMMQDEEFKRKANDIKFDLAFVEPFVFGPCNLILARYLEIPFVSMATILLPWELRIPALPSFYRVLGWYPIVDESTIIGRITNLISLIIAETSIKYPDARNTTLLRLYAPELHSWKELVRQSELILTDIDYHMGVPLPAFPYLVPVPGIATRQPESLKPEWEALFNENKHGIVVMSCGSMVRHIPKNTVRMFLEAFSRLKQTVVARLEPPTDGTVVPKNVKLVSWFPQNDLLGHANTRLFITHCGNSGQHEMLYHGVPFIGLPLFGDQDMNCNQAQEKGYGIKLNIITFTPDELFGSMEEVLNNQKYKKAIKRASEIFRDEPLTPRKKAVHWIEHVIKYGGGHLRSKALDLPLYQFLMLDVFGLLVIMCLAITVLVKSLVVVGLRKLWYAKPELKRNETAPETNRDFEKLKFRKKKYA